MDKLILPKPIPRYLPIFSLILQTLVGGIRFSDGKALLAISSGQDINALIFQEHPGNQYLWESPLKVILLRTLPLESFINLGFFFTLIAILPIIGIFWNKKTKFYNLSSLVILTTLLLKISIQNIGVGDGLTILLCIGIILNFSNLFFTANLLLMLGLWHPGQALFIGISTYLGYNLHYEILNVNSSGAEEMLTNKKKYVYFLSILLPILLSRLLLLIHNKILGFEYLNRLSFIKENFGEIIYLNLSKLLALIIPLGLFILICTNFRNLKSNIRKKILIWITFCSIVSLLTTDVTRVGLIILTPIILIVVDNLSWLKFNSYYSYRFIYILKPHFIFIFFSAFVPILSWSGINISLWGAFIDDLCKYGLYCKI